MRQATFKLNNNRAAGPDRISAELVKYAPVEVHLFIQELLNRVLENHQMLDTGRGSLCPLYKPGKPKCSVKKNAEKNNFHHATEPCEAKV